MHMSAVAAYPYSFGIILKHLVIFDSFQQQSISCFMLFFHRRQILEKHGDFRITFVFGNGAHILINGCPFLMFPRNTCDQIGFCGANAVKDCLLYTSSAAPTKQCPALLVYPVFTPRAPAYICKNLSVFTAVCTFFPETSAKVWLGSTAISRKTGFCRA